MVGFAAATCLVGQRHSLVSSQSERASTKRAPPGLRHHAVIGRDHHQHQGVVHIADPRRHVLEETLVARHVEA
jgi:hypothetical protein